MRSKFIISLNQLPTFTSSDDALYRRLIFIPFNTKFVSYPKHKNEKKLNTNLASLIEHNDSIKIRFINVLIRYAISDEQVQIPSTLLEYLATLKTFTDCFDNFLENNIELSSNTVITLNDVLQVYLLNSEKPDCHTKEYKIYLKQFNEFINKLNARFGFDNTNEKIKYSVHRHIINGVKKQTRGYKGIKIKSPEILEELNEDSKENEPNFENLFQ